MIPPCKHCGKPVHHVRALFCSRVCYWTYRGTGTDEYRRVEYKTLICGHCGKEFQRRKQEAERAHTQFCSRKCAGTITGGTPVRKPSQPSYNKPCEVCGKLFNVKASRDVGRFCSRACMGVWRSTDILGAGNPNHRHGQNAMSARTVAMRCFPAQCIICQWSISVDIHHIVPKTQGGDNTPRNLAVLCPNHHRMAEMNLLTSDELQSRVDALLANVTNVSSGMPS